MNFFIFATVVLFLSHSAFAARQVEFEWETIAGAKAYQVEIRNKENIVRVFNSKTSTFKFKMASGRYQIRGKVQGESPLEVKSDWSEWKEFNIPPDKVHPLKLKKITPILKPHSYVAEVPIDWDDTEGASEYLLEVMNANNEVVETQKVKTHSATVQLRPGLYKVKMTAFTHDGVASEPSISKDTLSIENIPVEPPQILKMDLSRKIIELKSIPETEQWANLERQAFLGETWTKLDQSQIKDQKYILKNLKPGKYRATFWSVNKFGDNSKPTVKEFIIKPQEPDLPK